jgi:hypothetical protein
VSNGANALFGEVWKLFRVRQSSSSYEDELFTLKLCIKIFCIPQFKKAVAQNNPLLEREKYCWR